MQRFGHRPPLTANPYLCRVKTKPSTAPHSPYRYVFPPPKPHRPAPRSVRPSVLHRPPRPVRLHRHRPLSLPSQALVRRAQRPLSSAPRPLNSPTVYNTQQAAHYIHTAQPAANAPRTLNTPAADNTQPAAHYIHTAQAAAPAPQSLNTPRPLNAPNAYNTQQAAHYTSQTQPISLRIPSPERFVAMLIRLFRTDIIYVRIGNCNLRIRCIPALILLVYLLFLW